MRTTSPTRRALVLATGMAMALTAAACSGLDDPDSTPEEPTTSAAAAPAGESVAAPCTQGPTLDPVEAEPVEGTDSDLTLTSFDGTEIRMHWFPAPERAEPAPTVLMGPGWSLPGDTSVDGAALFGALGIASLHESGYNVLTWDPRGFGASGGAASVNDPALEGRDVQGLIDWVATQPEAQLDRAGDPRMGMVGFSYGGGIQLTVAALDCRVDAIVPGLAWHSLETSLFGARTVKAGWASVLTSSAAGGTLDPHITSAAESGIEEGLLSAEDEEWFRSRGPADLVEDITIPTLFIQGTVDALFTLQEALTVADVLEGNGVPHATLWFCGGHGVCLVDPGDGRRVAEASFAWLDRWVKGDESVRLGPAFDVIDQDGTRWTGEQYPAEPDATLTASGSGTLALDAASAAGPIELPEDVTDLLAGVVQGITPAPAEVAVEVALEPVEEATLLVGAPMLTLRYRGETPPGEKPTRLFAQLVDDQRDVVVGTVVTPIPITLDGTEQTVEVPMEVIAQHLAAGDSLTLQLVATTVAYAVPRLGGSVELLAVDLELPVVTSLERG